MDLPVRAFVPIRSFDGMTRLGSALTPRERKLVAVSLARRTTGAASEASVDVAVVTNDGEVRRWADALDMVWVAEPEPGNLNDAAAAAVASADGRPWMIVHADLPSVTAGDIRTAASLALAGTVLAPSHDGGTSLIGGLQRSFPFRYGPGSFGRHFAAVGGRATVLVRPGFALDLDSPRDLEAFRTLGYPAVGVAPEPGIDPASNG
jgi:2-phospho-L-lactate guanylyltransferase